MTGTFKANNPYNTFLLFVYGILLKLPMFLHPKVPQVQQIDGFLYRALLKWLQPIVGNFPGIYAIFAFLLNLAREVVKDIEDVKGDLELRSKTLPISVGEKRSKWFIGIVLSIAVLAAGLFIYLIEAFTFINVIPGILAAVVILIAIFLLVTAHEKSQFRRVNHFIKLAMTVGLLTPVYWKIISTYVQF